MERAFNGSTTRIQRAEEAKARAEANVADADKHPRKGFTRIGGADSKRFRIDPGYSPRTLPSVSPLTGVRITDDPDSGGRQQWKSAREAMAVPAVAPHTDPKKVPLQMRSGAILDAIRTALDAGRKDLPFLREAILELTDIGHAIVRSNPHGAAECERLIRRCRDLQRTLSGH
jgi:hypothetical protein